MESFSLRRIPPGNKSLWQVFQHLKPPFQISDQCLLLEYFLISIIIIIFNFTLTYVLFHPIFLTVLQEHWCKNVCSLKTLKCITHLMRSTGHWQPCVLSSVPLPLLCGCPCTCLQLVELTKGSDSCFPLQPGEEGEERAVEKRSNCTLNLDESWAWE